jgi:hypothetical protein
MPMERSSEKSGVWTSARIVTIFILALGIILGVLIAHYFVEPALGDRCVEALGICKSQVQVLNEENDACYQQNYDLNRLLEGCTDELEQYRAAT